jgi:PhoPQ-activated pathogenicity-related protein
MKRSSPSAKVSFPRHSLSLHFTLAITTASVGLLLVGSTANGRESTAAAAGSHTRSGPNGVTALDRYVATPDPNYSFKLITSAPTPAGTVYEIEMISQQWLTTNEVNHPIWKHWLSIAVPKDVKGDTGFLYITGGSNEKPLPSTPEEALKRSDGNLIRIAIETKSVTAELHNVPNEPVIFGNDGVPRTEDKLIAYTWDKFLRNGDDRWPARLPMTKAAVRAMDTITKFCASDEGGKVSVEKFMVAGGSKRGWTTWTTAAVDTRVIAIAPIVIDVLNNEKSMRHHYAAYGFWAPAIRDYEDQHIMDWMGTPQNKALAKIEDPYEYRQRYTMPKLVVNDTGDQFFVPDSSQFYYDGLPGPKYLRYVPNTDHSMKGSDAWETVQAFYQSILQNKPLPRYEWAIERNGSIKVKATDAPREIKLWQATNPDARDFRLETLGPKWTSSPLMLEKGAVVARVPEPKKGWTAFMVELTYDGPGKQPLKLTTGVKVVPDKTDFEFEPRPPIKK